MPVTAAVFTSDPNLLRCELARLGDEIVFAASNSESMGAGWFADGSVLLQRYSAKARPERMEHLGGLLESQALLVHSAPLPLGMSLEENTQPFRFRQWLFAYQGTTPANDKLRIAVLDSLPEHLARVMRGSTTADLAFAVFLAELRAAGKTDEESLNPADAARILGASARKLEQHAQEAGVRGAALVFMATNNNVLAVARLGDQPVHYRLLEGTPTCEICRLDASAPKSTPLVRAHMQRRLIAVSTGVTDPRNWIALADGEAVGVDANLTVKRVTF